MNTRVVSAVAFVVLFHAALIVLLLTVRDEPPSRPLESHSITAELLSAAPAVAPAALQSAAPAPKPAPPVPHPKPKVETHPTPVVKRTTPEPSPLVAVPAPNAAATPESTPAPPPAAPTTNAPPAAAAAAASAPAIGRDTLTIAAPKDVAHLDCSIAKPEYPTLSQRRGEAGTAYVRFVVGLTGKIEDIELKKSSGFARLDDAALAAMRASACHPYVENGAPVRAAYTQPFTFGFTD